MPNTPPNVPAFDPAAAWRAPYAATPYDLWTRTNVGEVSPRAVTPLTFSIMTAIGEAVFLGQPERIRLIPSDLLRDGLAPSAFRAINGRMFYNTGLIHHIFTDRFGFPSWFWMLSLGGPQDPSGAYLEKKPLRPLRVLRSLPDIVREGRRQRRVVAEFERDQAQMRAHAASLRREDLSQMSGSALLGRLAAVAHMAEAPEAQLFDGSAAALNAYGILAGLCQRWCGDRALANDLVTGLATVRTADATLDLWRVARAVAASPPARAIVESALPMDLRERLHGAPAAAPVAAMFDRFFEDFGHRCVDEFELSAPRWSEDPTFIASTLRTYLNAPPETDPSIHLQRQRRRRAEAEREARRRMARGTLYRLLPYRWVVFRAVLRQAQRLLPMRENPKHHFLLFAGELRRTILELAHRLVSGGLLDTADDVFFLTRDELIAAAEAGERGMPAPALRGIVAARRALYARYDAWTPPDAVPGSQIATVEAALGGRDEGPGKREEQAGTEPPTPNEAAGNAAQMRRGPDSSLSPGPSSLSGIAASAGRVTARARVALTPDEGAEIEPGEVLVAPFTNPGWTPLFTVAAAVVMDLGGLLSHGAIVAREYGIPAVVNTRTATTAIRTGRLITVDGDHGTVSWENDDHQGGMDGD